MGMWSCCKLVDNTGWLLVLCCFLHVCSDSFLNCCVEVGCDVWPWLSSVALMLLICTARALQETGHGAGGVPRGIQAWVWFAAK